MKNIVVLALALLIGCQLVLSDLPPPDPNSRQSPFEKVRTVAQSVWGTKPGPAPIPFPHING